MCGHQKHQVRLHRLEFLNVFQLQNVLLSLVRAIFFFILWFCCCCCYPRRFPFFQFIIKKSSTCDYRFCSYLQPDINNFISTQTFWLSIGINFFFFIILYFNSPLVASVFCFRSTRLHWFAWNISIKLPKSLCGKRNLLNFIWLKQQ